MTTLRNAAGNARLILAALLMIGATVLIGLAQRVDERPLIYWLELIAVELIRGLEKAEAETPAEPTARRIPQVILILPKQAEKWREN